MDPLNLILLIIVALVAWRLRSVLGTRNDDEKPGSRADAYRLNRDAFANKSDERVSQSPPQDLPQDLPQDAPQNTDETAAENTANHDASSDVADAEPRQAAEDTAGAQPEMGRGLAFLREVEPQFDEAVFLEGATRAYEMILTAFADGDLSPVEGFLGADVTDGFAQAIVARRADNLQLVTQILRIDRPALEDAVVGETSIQLDVRFRSEIISGQFAADQEVGEDDLPAPTTSIDVWRFEGQRGGAPNWMLIATSAG